LNPPFNSEPVERFKNWIDVQTLWSLEHSSSCRIKNELKTIELILSKIQKQRVAVVEF